MVLSVPLDIILANSIMFIEVAVAIPRKLNNKHARIAHVTPPFHSMNINKVAYSRVDPVFLIITTKVVSQVYLKQFYS